MMSKESIWSTHYRALTIGIILVVTATAFEGLAVTTIAPGLSRELQGNWSIKKGQLSLLSR